MNQIILFSIFSFIRTFGVILFDLVCGHFPFENDSDVLIHQEKDIKFSKNGLTEEFKDLIRKCLAFYVAERIVIEKILTHPWMNIWYFQLILLNVHKKELKFKTYLYSEIKAASKFNLNFIIITFNLIHLILKILQLNRIENRFWLNVHKIMS